MESVEPGFAVVLPGVVEVSNGFWSVFIFITMRLTLFMDIFRIRFDYGLLKS